MVIVDFSERDRTSESRKDFIERKLIQAKELSVKENRSVTLKGYMFTPDIKRIEQLTDGLLPSSAIKRPKGDYLTTYIIWAGKPKG